MSEELIKTIEQQQGVIDSLNDAISQCDQISEAKSEEIERLREAIDNSYIKNFVYSSYANNSSVNCYDIIIEIRNGLKLALEMIMKLPKGEHLDEVLDVIATCKKLIDKSHYY